MEIEVNQAIRNWQLFQDLNDADIQKILDCSEKLTFKNGENICAQGEVGESMFIIFSGRVNMVVSKPNGKEQNLNILQSGNHIGELALLSGGTRTATATAISDVTVLEIQKDDFHTLLKEIPAFSINLSRTISQWLQGELKGNSIRKKLNVVSLVRSAEITGQLASQLVQWLKEKKDTVALFTDRPDDWSASSEISKESVHPIFTESAQVDFDLNQREIIKATDQYEHVIIDIDQTSPAIELLSQSERVWWFVEQNASKGGDLFDTANELMHKHPSMKQRIQLVWVQVQQNELAEIHPQKLANVLPDIRFVFEPGTKHCRPQDLSRLYHMLKGVHLGIALGGGGARCLAHIGVLAALEENDLYFDRVSGTSGGAIIATFYAAGFSKEHMLKLFEIGMTPPHWVKYIPHGNKWYLMALFRFGLIEKRFHQIFDGTDFEQLLLPTHIVSTDLISGMEVVRSSGNVADSVIESTNHPLLGKPVFRNGESLVDGGILNNVPSSVLRSANADYVVSVNIGAKLSKKFGENSENTAKSEMKKVGFLGTLSRVLEVGQNGLEKLYEKESDFYILPDTSDFQFEDFTRNKELFDVGYNAAMEVMPELKANYQEFINS